MLQGPGLVVAAATGENSPTRPGQGFDSRAVDESLESLESHSGSLGSISEYAECAVEEGDAPATGSEFQVGILRGFVSLPLSPVLRVALEVAGIDAVDYPLFRLTCTAC